ncbi:hypothetical protein TIFTF001_035909 [Ficus carica]|uniref:Uncharacterized protein n=1 Tax=Ficus carica TaxID=3494 RepID=A0AA88E2D1_FICCA|nr:hypothetical protein TIFTF001_035881 [Ficus carica]GMN66823.1 hypothetical protein TIFTF001_035887 [Ficus carica]GMN66834.1 hypothetical protein TIFTF001_035903 [Ficus carica]GMN66845.1 hypothetical protein TIFTF001_035909 [Ficus carica]
MEESLASLDSEVKKVRHAEKVAERKGENVLKKADEAQKKVEDALRMVEETRKKVEDDLSAARSEHCRYLQKVLPAALDQAGQQAVTEYQNSDEFEARLLANWSDSPC